MGSVEDVLKEIEEKIKELLPSNVVITSIEFEGPELVIYTKDPQSFAEGGNLVRKLAKDLRKRIVIRPDPNILMEPERATDIIKDIVPEEAGIKNLHFNPDTGEVFIETEKPGIVIGKHGSTLREITKKIGWSPIAIRAPPIDSTTVTNIRKYMRDIRDERKKILRAIGRRIHRPLELEEEWVRLTALGGFREVGRSCTLISTPASRVFVDCGVSVGSENRITPYLNIPEAIPLNGIDAVVITHAHLDHSGLVPLLFKYGYEGPVYVTPPTRDLMVLLQLDYIEVAAREGKTIPYDSSLIRKSLKYTIPLDYGEVTDITPDIKLTFHNAGHILGSAICHFHIGEGLHNIVFTGDFKFEKTRLFDPAVCKFPRVETLVMEATYGGSQDYQPSRRTAESNLIKIVNETVKRGGKVLIPAFAVGRSQEVMLVLEEAIRKGAMEEVPIYLDGMIWEATAIHTTHPEYLNNELRDMIFRRGLNPFLSDCFIRVDSKDKRLEIIDDTEPCVILATSGMLNGGPVMEYFNAMAPIEKNTLIFVGYQAEGTIGRRIQKGWSEIPYTKNGRIETIKLRMQIETVDGFSGHSDRRQLMSYVHNISPKPNYVITNHGDEKACVELASSIYKKYQIQTRSPLNLETVRLL
ncbi:beta-CASP ribonuclease aCPSF1 [Methanosarcinales archaeon]|nr:MAG: beta-CASP ribonuclease aCPSF1 [Methanosarcinales archaeon]